MNDHISILVDRVNTMLSFRCWNSLTLVATLTLSTLVNISQPIFTFRPFVSQCAAMGWCRTRMEQRVKMKWNILFLPFCSLCVRPALLLKTKALAPQVLLPKVKWSPPRWGVHPTSLYPSIQNTLLYIGIIMWKKQTYHYFIMFYKSRLLLKYWNLVTVPINDIYLWLLNWKYSLWLKITI